MDRDIITEIIETVNGVPLRLSFESDAIRSHFEGEDSDPTEGMTDSDLAAVGYFALTDDTLYETFHQVLVTAVDHVKAAPGPEIEQY